jgi:uncharacterized protein (DUF1501 family)
VPFADPAYVMLRPQIGVRRDEVLQLSERAGLHPALAPLMPLWQGGRLALLQGVGYPRPNLSHFRSIEIWDTASASEDTLTEGWLARSFAAVSPPPTFAADAVVIGSNDMGPLSGGQRVIALGGSGAQASGATQFLRQSRLATASGEAGSGALAHIRRVESEIRQAAGKLAEGSKTLATVFPTHAFGNAVKSACEVLSTQAGVACLRLTLNGFDTHQNQPGTHANLLKQLAEGLVALQSGLDELGLWQKTLVLSYAEFGRRPKENQSRGTDHGTANVHFALGGRVRGGLFGAAPELAALDGNGNLAHTTDFRSVYATVLERWWQMDSRQVLRGRFPVVDFLA